jgi:N-sulfoglucosamine sulfohydrolase
LCEQFVAFVKPDAAAAACHAGQIDQNDEMHINSCLVALLSLGLAGSMAAAAEQRPNILWITCEDMSPRLGCYGDQTVPTPNIDRLAEQGVCYTHAFATTGVCAPSRHALITGMYPTATYALHMRTGQRSAASANIADPALRVTAMSRPLYEAVPPAHVRCFSEHLRAAGYYCTNNVKTDYQFKPPVTAWDVSSRNAHPRNRAPGQAFFAVFNFTVTHESGLFRKERSPQVCDPQKVSVPPFFPDIDIVRQDIARQYDHIAQLDREVGELLDALEQEGLLENTIIFFFSDHGDGLPRHKRWVLDSGTRVPLIIRYPDGRGAGTTDDRLLSFVDFGPAVLSLAGVSVPEGLHGTAFLGKQAGEPRRHVFMHRDRMDDINFETIRSVRDHRYRYVRNYRPDEPYSKPLPYHDQIPMMQALNRMIAAGELGPDQWQFSARRKAREELYDTQLDPHEIRNIAQSPEQAQRLDALREELDRWLALTQDPLHTPEQELIRTHIWPPDGVQPKTAAPQITIDGDGLRITCDTPGASIGYRLHGDRTGIWRRYSEPLRIERIGQVEAVAHRIGFLPSEPVISRLER